jgi:hypothetical protein
MKLGDAVKEVLKKRSGVVIKETLFQDSKWMLSFLRAEARALSQSGSNIRALKASVQNALLGTKELLRVLPARVRDGLNFFREDFLYELDQKTDGREKTEFCFKVLGALASDLAEMMYSFKAGKANLAFKGFRRSSPFTLLLAQALVLRFLTSFLHRLLSEVEAGVSDVKDRTRIKYLKDLIGRDILQVDSPGDEAIEIVEKLKNYILTGVREL